MYIYMHLFMARVPIGGTTLYTRSLTFKKLWSLYYITYPSPRGSNCHHRSVSPLPIFPVMKLFYCVHSADTSAMLDPFVTFLLNPQRRTCIFKVGCTANLLCLSISVVQKLKSTSICVKSVHVHILGTFSLSFLQYLAPVLCVI